MIAGTGKERAKKPQPPPIDPGVFRSVIDIRRYVDEGQIQPRCQLFPYLSSLTDLVSRFLASDLAIRASSGLSAFNVSSAGAQCQPDRPTAKNGREPNMSAIRTHRLRVMACQRLAGPSLSFLAPSSFRLTSADQFTFLCVYRGLCHRRDSFGRDGDARSNGPRRCGRQGSSDR
jgi:hypothetical protein